MNRTRHPPTHLLLRWEFTTNHVDGLQDVQRVSVVNFTTEQIQGLLAAAYNFQGHGMAASENCRGDFREVEREEDNKQLPNPVAF